MARTKVALSVMALAGVHIPGGRVYKVNEPFTRDDDTRMARAVAKRARKNRKRFKEWYFTGQQGEAW